MSGDGETIFLNHFTVSGGTVEEFEREFERSAEFMRGRAGFVRSVLARDTQAGDSFVNIAHWCDEAALREAASRPEFADHVAALREISTRSHAFYRPRLLVLPGGVSPTRG